MSRPVPGALDRLRQALAVRGGERSRQPEQQGGKRATDEPGLRCGHRRITDPATSALIEEPDPQDSHRQMILPETVQRAGRHAHMNAARMWGVVGADVPYGGHPNSAKATECVCTQA